MAHPKHYRIHRQLAVCVLVLITCLLAFTGCTDLAPAEVSPETSLVTRPAITKAPAFTVSNLMITPSETKIRDKVGISVLVANNGAETGTHEVVLEINGQHVQ